MQSKMHKVLLLSMTALALISETRQSERRRQKEQSSIYPYNNNICDVSDRDSKVHCYCESEKDTTNATKAECWVFNGGILPNDTVWSNFGTQPNLRILSFNVRADGGLGFVPSAALKYLQSLTKVNIKYASIQNVSSQSFANLSSLKEIVLTKNKIEHLNAYAFTHLPNLTVLTLDENKIRQLDKNVFHELPSLEKLYITNNNVSAIEGGSFKHLINLFELEMDMNALSVLRHDMFEGLANLNRLDLRKNRIVTLSDFTFTELWNLNELLLDGNGLQFIYERAFDGLSQLKRLSLSNNALKKLSEGLFEGVRGLRSLDLHSNALSYLTYDTIKPIYDNLEQPTSDLILHGNKLLCDCRLIWVHGLKNDTKSANVKTSLTNVTCVFDNQHWINVEKTLNTERIRIETNAILLTNEKPQMVAPQNEKITKRNATKVERKHGKENIRKDAANTNAITTVEPIIISKENYFVRIPPELLPCPASLKNPTESTFIYPSQDEVKDYRNYPSQSSASAARTAASAQTILYITVFNVFKVLGAKLGEVKYKVSIT